jgi:hypothetical protein
MDLWLNWFSQLERRIDQLVFLAKKKKKKKLRSDRFGQVCDIKSQTHGFFVHLQAAM